jgi:hypothetical protein
MEKFAKILNFEYFIIFLIIQILIIYLTYIRSIRFKNLDIKLVKNLHKISISEIQVYLSFTRWISFIFPFKIGDIISFYIIKKKLIKLFSSSMSYFLGCKFYEFLNLLIISILICSIFFLETKFTEYNKSFIRFLYSMFLITVILLIFFIKKNKKRILKINFKNIYLNDFKLLINSNNFFTYTFVISLIQFTTTVLLIFICSDATIDNELFFLSTAYIILNLIPIRLPLNVGAFDIFAGLGNYIYDYGLTIDNLVLFRLIQLILFSTDFGYWYLISKFSSIKKNF